MTVTNGYCTLTELKSRLGISDTTDDTILEQNIMAASRWIDQFSGRVFFTSGSGAVRYYTADTEYATTIDDCLSVTAVATDDNEDRTWSTSWAGTDWYLSPVNASAKSAPYTEVFTTPNGAYSFPLTLNGVKITGNWGYAASTPDPVHEACLIQSERLFKRKDAPFGIAGSPDPGGQMRLLQGIDPDVAEMLAPYRRLV